MRRVVPPANLPYKYARVYKDVVVLTVAGSLDLPARHLVPRLPRPIVLAVLLFVPVPSVQASPPAAEEDLPPTHVIADHVVISEVKPNGAGTNEFVELYNPTNQPIEMIDWKLTSAARASESDLANGFTGTIPAFGYFLSAVDIESERPLLFCTAFHGELFVGYRLSKRNHASLLGRYSFARVQRRREKGRKIILKRFGLFTLECGACPW